MKMTEVSWNDEAREKILHDADNVLRDAVAGIAKSMADSDSDTIFAALNGALKDQFIDYKPGPDIRKYADAIAKGELEL